VFLWHLETETGGGGGFIVGLENGTNEFVKGAREVEGLSDGRWRRLMWRRVK